MPAKEIVLKTIVNQGLLPLFFHSDAALCLEVVKTLYKAGIRTLEFTNRGEAALENFAYLKKESGASCPDLLLGIGTIKTVDEARAFIKAGADYIVCPVVNPEVAQVSAEAGLLWIPGCMTPTEIFTAQQQQAALTKIFPANILGPAFISSIRELFPNQLFMPTGGVEIEMENLNSWFRAGVCAVGMGSKLISTDILKNRNFDLLYANTIKAMELIQQVK